MKAKCKTCILLLLLLLLLLSLLLFTTILKTNKFNKIIHRNEGENHKTNLSGAYIIRKKS